MGESKNVIIAVVISFIIIFGWQTFYEKPRIEKTLTNTNNQHTYVQNQIPGLIKEFSTIQEALSSTQKVDIENPSIIGSISTKGLRIDNLQLKQYKESMDNNADYHLLSPSGTKNAYFAFMGVYSEQDHPGENTIWNASDDKLSNNKPVTFSWTNKDGVKFFVKMQLDENYMFTITNSIENSSGQDFKFSSYGVINHNHHNKDDQDNVFQGGITVLSDELKEVSYSDIKDKQYNYNNAQIDWIGFTNKYWLTAYIMPKKDFYNTNFVSTYENNHRKYQMDFLSSMKSLSPSEKYSETYMFFAGPKNINIIDKYKKSYNIQLFDRAVDFGWFYFLTKPILFLLIFLSNICKDMGLSIIILTIIVRVIMFPLANFSLKSMEKMKQLQPRIEEIRKSCKDDKMRMNQEIMYLYKASGVNPVAGCLPLLLQIPIFFAVYKVLCIAVQMRQANFYWLISDLAKMDPTNIFTAFGYINWSPPGFMHVGIWAMLMAATMYIQQQLTPTNATMDPAQAKMMKMMPLVFLFIFAKFPCGLLLYWTASNILSIFQQMLISRLYKK